VWHAGDDLAWAAPGIDESGWLPYSERQPDFDQHRLWVRCHVDLSPLRALAHPAVQVRLYAAYELYLDGVRIGAKGNLRSGNSSLSVPSYSIPNQLISSAPATLALRISEHYILADNLALRFLASPLLARAGDAPLLEALLAQQIIVGESRVALMTISFGFVGVLAFILLALFFVDGARPELLPLSIACLTLCALRLTNLAATLRLNYSIVSYLAAHWAGLVVVPVAQISFWFVLARRRVPRAIVICLLVIPLVAIPEGVILLAAPSQSEWINPLRGILQLFSQLMHIAILIAPFVAFWPFSAITPRMRPLAILCMLWGAMDFMNFEYMYLTQAGLQTPLDLTLINVRGITIASVLIALLALLFREHRHVALEHAQLAGEMHAASEIQRMLEPAALNCAPGMQIEVAFHPFRDVGGDFYLCSVLPDGHQRVVLGDVSGKGSAAAMTAALLLGGAADHHNDSAAELLAHLNRVLLDSKVRGFATCLCADFSADGKVTLANAGHLAPFLRGEEISVPPGLPLGLNERSADAYQQIIFNLEPSDTITFISDGVVEARSSTGELFGFDRTRAISNMSAGHIARTAQSHGQEDDITVLTLTFAPVGVAHA
jgi:hypothetical protein